VVITVHLYTSIYIRINQVERRLGTNIKIYALYILDVFPNYTNVYLGQSPSISGQQELILMTEKSGLIETSFADAIAMIAAAKELPEQTRRHWVTSLRQSAKALDRPLEVIPARYSAVRADLINLHE